MTDTSGPLTSTTVDTPVGQLTVVVSAVGVRAVLWPSDDPNRVRLADVDQPSEACDHPVAAAAVRQLTEYFDGDRQDFDLPLDPQGTEFQRSAWAVLRSVRFGETMSYAEQAERMGDRRKARAVGAANGRNPISIVVPCHRVVGANGALTGFAGGVDTKEWLLMHELRVGGHTLDI